MIGIGRGDLLNDSLARLRDLDEFGIGIEGAIPHAFKRYNENSSESIETYQRLCWDFLPEEESFISEMDDWGFPGQPRCSKREQFILNAESIEKEYGLLLAEIGLVYAEAFYLVGMKASDICVVGIDEVQTCLHYWK